MAEERLFLGDDNRAAKDMQQRAYPHYVLHLFGLARERFEAACRLVGTEPDILREALAIESVERPVLQQAYARIAAWYRYSTDGGRQLRLCLLPDDAGAAGPDYTWWEFFAGEAKWFVASSDAVVRLTLVAVAARGSGDGQVAEARLADRIADGYGPLSVARRFRFNRCSPGSGTLAFWRSAERRLGFGRARLLVPARHRTGTRDFGGL